MDLGSLLRAAASGDRQAADLLVERTFPDVWRFARHLVGPHRAEDAVQTAYLRAWGSLTKTGPIDDVKAWLLAITWRACTDVMRSDDRHRRRLQEVQRHASPAVYLPADTTRVEELLQLLDPDRRAAFVLTQLLGYRYAEAATICDTEIGTIRSRVARARFQLLEAVRADSEDETGTQ